MGISKQRTKRLTMSEIKDELIFRGCYKDPEFSEILDKLQTIYDLREEKNAIILAHFYQWEPIQLIADAMGDSLFLAQSSDLLEGKDFAVASSVNFMAEMIKLLNPDKKILIPDREASCSIAEGMSADTVKLIRKNFPLAKIITYINTNADVKAEVDIVCTSANAKQILSEIKDEVIVIPDYFFAKNIYDDLPIQDSHKVKDVDGGKSRYLAYKGIEHGKIVLDDLTNNKKIELEQYAGMILPKRDKGTCIVHEEFSSKDIAQLRNKHGVQRILAHPEVNPNIVDQVDAVTGTNGMLKYIADPKNADVKTYSLLSECGISDVVTRMFPEKEFFTLCKLCPYMRKNTLDGIIHSLKNEVYEVVLNPETEIRARKALANMNNFNMKAAGYDTSKNTPPIGMGS